MFYRALHALAWGLLPNFISIAIFEFIIGLGHTRIIMYFIVLSVSLVIFFSYSFIFGAFGFPALGIAGADWGMTISYWIIAIVISVFVLIHKDYKHYFRSILKKNKPSYFEATRISLFGALRALKDTKFTLLGSVKQ